MWAVLPSCGRSRTWHDVSLGARAQCQDFQKTVNYIEVCIDCNNQLIETSFPGRSTGIPVGIFIVTYILYHFLPVDLPAPR